ncbi:MAG: TlpA family protein disulfide reductase [Anaerolineaceae bacterium]|nr:TlpA family protein disulfide reductase [Anaerolineaceae bacterium]
MKRFISTRVDTQPAPAGVPVWVIIISFLLLISFLILIGIGLYHAQPRQLIIGQSAPDFSLVSFDGQLYNKDVLAGKIVILHFWASWCGPCENEAVLIENTWRRINDKADVLILGIDHADTEDDALQFLQENRITYPNGADKKSLIADAYRINGVPQTVILDRTGKIAFIQIGPFLSADSLIEIIEGIY